MVDKETSIHVSPNAPPAVSSEAFDFTAAALVVEILDYQNRVSDPQAIKYFFDDLADGNGCEEGVEVRSGQV